MAAAAVITSPFTPEDHIHPHTNSCISLSTTSEPCVNKTIQHLETLKKCISIRSAVDNGRKLKASFSDLPDHHNPPPSTQHSTRICVEGKGVLSAEKPSAGFLDEVTEAAINLVMRLEEDRIETVRSLEKEWDRTVELQTTLDTELERRLVLIEAAVQEG